MLTRRELPAPRMAVRRKFFDPRSGDLLDEGLLLWFAGPASHTGEDVAEIHHHGGRGVAEGLAAALGDMVEVRLAEPGEFTRRAFLAGKIDLSEAEAVADLVDATTRAQARQAVRQLDGALGRLVSRWSDTVLDVLAKIEAEIDFSADEGDVSDDLLAAARPALEMMASEIQRELQQASRGQKLRDGIVIAVIGAPNVGKSSLVNLLARRDVAIVTASPGTTRDVLEVPLELAGVPVLLLDTAGLRESSDAIEQEGIRRARERAAKADLCLEVLDARDDSAAVQVGADRIVILNKLDLAERARRDDAIGISCVDGRGIPELLTEMERRAASLAGEGSLVTRARHHDALKEAERGLDRLLTGPVDDLAIVGEELRGVARALGRITGSFGVDEVLERIFSQFCIGK